MSKRAEMAAMKALPDYSPDGKHKVDLTLDRLLFQHGYEQAEKDLALTPEDVVVLVNLYEYGKANGWTAEDVIRRFNEQRKK